MIAYHYMARAGGDGDGLSSGSPPYKNQFDLLLPCRTQVDEFRNGREMVVESNIGQDVSLQNSMVSS